MNRLCRAAMGGALAAAALASTNISFAEGLPPARSVETAGAREAFPLPKLMHFCNQHCVSLKLDKDRYVNAEPLAASATWGTVWTIESFTRESIILHRTDTNAGRTVFSTTITGQVSADGNQLVNGRSGGHQGNERMTWGSALNSIPARDSPALPQTGIPNFWAAVALLGPLSEPANETPLAKMNRLEAQMESARLRCTHDNRSGYKLDHESCREAERLETEYFVARRDWQESAMAICDAADALAAECKAGRQDSCKKVEAANRAAGNAGCIHY